MAELTTLARPYAKAVFEYALDHDELKLWSTQLKLAAAISEDAKVHTLLRSPVRAAAEKADVFIEIGGKDFGAQLGNFIRILAEHQRFLLLPQIAVLFEQYKADQEKSLEVQVTSAFALSKEQQERLTKVLSARLSREVRLQTSEDPALIGGVLIRAGDLIIDGSVRGKVAKLAEALKS